MKVYIDPRTEYRYTSYYRLGLYRVFGGKKIIYSVKPFLDLKCENLSQFGSGLQMIIEDEGKQVKFFIDTKDVSVIEQDKYDWADLYGKVNVAINDTKKYAKLVALGPAFAIRDRTLIRLLLGGIKNFFLGFSHTSIPPQLYFQTYLYLLARRKKIDFYEKKQPIKDNYIFHASTLWYNQFANTDTNMFRGEFLKACQKAGLIVEGGLFYVDGPAILVEMPDYPKYKEIYKDFIYDKRLSMDDYIRKTKESVVVFNTPSVCECHGWKLAEYLCMGKAIVSTPLTREMPGEGLIHGVNVHFVKTPEEIYDAVVKINTDEGYRKKLEKGAREYYEKWLAPEKVITRLLECAKINK